jgi:ferredoxin-NADP reductase
MRLRIRSITYLAAGVNLYEMVDPSGRDLPRFAAGAAIDLRLDGMVRQYWLAGDPAERRRYAVAVARMPGGGGLSHALHEARPGDLVDASPPEGGFPLAEDAARHLLLAEGVGIAPMIALIAVLRRARADFRLHYRTPSPDMAPFRAELSLLAAQGRVRFHDDGGPDLTALLRRPEPGTQLYVCGTDALIRAARDAAAEWPAGTLHSQSLSPPPSREPRLPAADRPFTVELAKRGVRIEVAAEETIVEALRRHDIAVRTSCELGYCGTCMTRCLAGEPEHRDQVLDEAARRQFVMICCARAKTPALELDL